MSDLRKFTEERRKFEVNLTTAMSPGVTIFQMQSVTAEPADDKEPDDLAIEDVHVSTVTCEFFVTGGTALREYVITLKWRSSDGEDLESRLTLLTR